LPECFRRRELIKSKVCFYFSIWASAVMFIKSVAVTTVDRWNI
jgi:hypothetical protein